MKILAISDVHNDRHFMQQMAQKGAEQKVDLVILAGDIFDEDQFQQGMIGPFKEKGLEVAVVPGNHEGLAEINAMVETYQVKNLHGYSLKLGDVGIFGCGYGDIGLHQLSDEQFFQTLKKSHETMKIPGWGSSGVRKAIEEFKPDIHICGHIHETHGIEELIGTTKVINVGKTGRIIEF